jgi:CNT family concentrative nucleoside transporter
MQHLIGLAGIAFILAIAYVASVDRHAIRWRLVAWGLGVQFTLAIFILNTRAGQALFQWLGRGITRLLDFSKVGSQFVFGKLVEDVPSFGFIFAFQVLPTIVFMAAVIGVLYHLGLIQRLVGAMAWLMARTLGVSGAESLSAAACVFVGQVEGPLLVRPYIAGMTRSELMALMTGGMATIAGGVMAAYIGMLGENWAPHLLAASLMGAPAGLVMAKMIVPETEASQTVGHVHFELTRRESSLIEAAAKGAQDGLQLALAVAAMLLAFISLVAMVNGGIAWVGSYVGVTALSLEAILGVLFFPLAFLIGVPYADAWMVGHLIGQKLVLNEFVSYAQLSEALRDGKIGERGAMLATFALCGFANVSSVAQNVGGIGQMAPERRADLARLGPRAMLAGALASCLSAAMVGILN